MAANRDPQLLLLFLVLVHLSDASSLTTPSPVAGTSHDTLGPLGPRGHGPQPVPHSEDYTDYEEPKPEPKPQPLPSRATALQHCDYDPCLDDQQPCHLLAQSTKCLCPGLSSHREPPEPPVLKRLNAAGPGVVVVQWCAPYSHVTAYKVTVGAAKPLEFGTGQRTAALGQVGRGAEVCVVAVNDAGDSAPSERSCMAFQPPGGDSVALKAGLIGGALGFLLLLSLAVLLWRLRARRKARI